MKNFQIGFHKNTLIALIFNWLTANCYRNQWADLGQSFWNVHLREEGLMVPIFATSTKANLLIYLGGGGFVLLGAFYFGRLVTFFFPKNPLIRKGKEENDA